MNEKVINAVVDKLSSYGYYEGTHYNYDEILSYVKDLYNHGKSIEDIADYIADNVCIEPIDESLNGYPSNHFIDTYLRTQMNINGIDVASEDDIEFVKEWFIDNKSLFLYYYNQYDDVEDAIYFTNRDIDSNIDAADAAVAVYGSAFSESVEHNDLVELVWTIDIWHNKGHFKTKTKTLKEAEMLVREEANKYADGVAWSASVDYDYIPSSSWEIIDQNKDQWKFKTLFNNDNISEAKRILRNNGYLLLKEDAYMDALDAEDDEVLAKIKNKTSEPVKQGLENGVFDFEEFKAACKVSDIKYAVEENSVHYGHNDEKHYKQYLTADMINSSDMYDSKEKASNEAQHRRWMNKNSRQSYYAGYYYTHSFCVQKVYELLHPYYSKDGKYRIISTWIYAKYPFKKLTEEMCRKLYTEGEFIRISEVSK